MAGMIDMMNEGIPMSNARESTIPSGGSAAGIEMFATPLPLSHTPVSSAQKGGAGAGIEMIGEQGLLNRNNVQRPYGAEYPTDKGE